MSSTSILLYSNDSTQFEGGFADLSLSSGIFNDGKTGDPILWSKAANTAWKTNVLAMEALGASNKSSSPDGRPQDRHDYPLRTSDSKGGSTQDWIPTEEQILIGDLRGEWHRDLPSTMLQDLGERYYISNLNESHAEPRLDLLWSQ